MHVRNSTIPSLIVLFALSACSSGQTGDAGLGVGTIDENEPEPEPDTDDDATPADDDAPAEMNDDASGDDAEPPDDTDDSSGDDEPPTEETPGAGTNDDSPPDTDDAIEMPDTGEGQGPDNPGLLLPCDVLSSGGLECVSAHSTVRVVVPGYDGPLYRVALEDGTTRDVGSLDGHADVEAHDDFCSPGACVIQVLYDQSGMGNDLTESPPGSAKPTPGKPVPASDHPVSIGGHSVYGMLFAPGMGYRKLVGNGTAQGDEPQTIYMVTSQHDVVNGCCFNYGNGETTANNDGNGAAEALNFGFGVIWGTGSGEGPWVMADLENGLYPGWENGQDRNISTNTSLTHDFVTAVLVGDTADKNDGLGRFALYGGDATAGTLTTMYDGIRPEKPGYVPMQKQGSVILGIGGDNSDGDGGRFYEGVMANGAASIETLDALQAAIVAARYGL